MSAAGWGVAVVLGVAGAGGAAEAESPDPRDVAPAPRRRPRELVIEIPGERSATNKLALASVAGAGVIAGAVGLYFNLDARSATQDVEAGGFSGKAWTQEQVDLVERADRSSTRAAVFYSIGGGLLLAAAITYIVTDPKSETSVIRTTRATPAVAPVAGGAVLGGAWRF